MSRASLCFLLFTILVIECQDVVEVTDEESQIEHNTEDVTEETVSVEPEQRPEESPEEPTQETLGTQDTDLEQANSALLVAWQQISEGFSKHKEKEKYCLAKMVDCMTDNSIQVDDSSINIQPEYEVVTTIIETVASINGRAVKYRCNMQNFMGLHQCCSHTPNDIFKGAILFACSEGQSMVPKSTLQEYILNIGQDERNTVNLTSTDTFAGNMLGSAVCFTDCVFRKRFLVSAEGAINLQMVRHHFSRSVGRSWEQTTLDAIMNCSSIVPKIHPEHKMRKSKFSRETCLVQPFLLMQCVRHRLLLACPASNKVVDREECKMKMERLNYCDVFKN